MLPVASYVPAVALAGSAAANSASSRDGEGSALAPGFSNPRPERQSLDGGSDDCADDVGPDFVGDLHLEVLESCVAGRVHEFLATWMVGQGESSSGKGMDITSSHRYSLVIVSPESKRRSPPSRRP